MKSVGFCALGLALVLAVSACDNGSSASTTTAPAPPTTTETLTGSVLAAVGGVQQSSFVKFTVGQAGTVAITLTKATEVFTDSTPPNPSVNVGLALGIMDAAGTSCAVATQVSLVSAASPPTFSVPFLAAAAACLQVSDQTVQTGRVDYTLVITHPI